MSMNFKALRELTADGHPAPGSTAVWLSDPPAANCGVAFASLVDLARMQFGAASVEICDACHTVNLGSAPCCKGCSHKLPAYYAARNDSSELACREEVISVFSRTRNLAHRASLRDFAAFALVINLVVMVAEFMPVQ